MQDIIQFVIHHWLLCSLFIILLILLFIEEARSKGLLGQIGPHELVQLMNRESAVVVDIRNREAFREGHIIGAYHMPRIELEKDFSQLNQFKDRPLVIVCTAGRTAGEVAVKLKKQHYEKVHVLSGGMDAWKNAHMPLVKS